MLITSGSYKVKENSLVFLFCLFFRTERTTKTIDEIRGYMFIVML